MKRSAAVRAFVVVSVAAALEGCGDGARSTCVDDRGNRADNRNCSSGGSASVGYHWVAAGGDAGAAESGTARGVIGGEGAAHGAEAGAHGGAGAGE